MTLQHSIIKNPGAGQKETQLNELQKAQRQLLRKLEREKTKLKVLKENIVHTQHTAFSAIAAKMEQIAKLQEELTAIFQRIQKSRRISKEDKKMFKQLAKEMLGGFNNNHAKEAKKEAGAEEEYQKSSGDFFTAYTITPKEEEIKDIRKIYLRLATQFHPDKARNPKESEKLHTLMQRINEAYKRGDIADLLDIEREYANKEISPEPEEEGLADFLQKQIDRISLEVQLLENQINRIKAEMKNISKSEMGKMHKQFSGSRSPIHSMTSDLDHAISSFTMMRDGLEQYVNTGHMPDELAAQLFPQETQADMDIDDLLDLLFELEKEEMRTAKKRRRR